MFKDFTHLIYVYTVCLRKVKILQHPVCLWQVCLIQFSVIQIVNVVAYWLVCCMLCVIYVLDYMECIRYLCIMQLPIISKYKKLVVSSNLDDW